MAIIRGSRKIIDINVIPLIDIVFFLVIFFMVAGTFRRYEALDVNLPKAQMAKEKTSNHTVIFLRADGKVAVNENIVNNIDLTTIINTLILNNPKIDIVIKSDSNVEAKDLIALMTQIKAAGSHSVSIQVKNHL